MFTVKTLPKEDYQFAVELANTMNWNMSIDDFEFSASLEPDGCFLLLEVSKKVGIATCNSYGKMGWFGNLIVEKKYRNRGAATTLVKHAVKYLLAKGVQTVGLYAYPNLTAFYGNLGFKADEDFSVIIAKNLEEINAHPLPKIGAEQFPDIINFDSTYFGGNRRKLFESTICNESNAGYYIAECGEVVGYIASTIYEKMAWVGPMICKPKRYDVALQLMKSALSKMTGRTAFAVVPKNDTELLSTFLDLGFREDFFVSRMFLGESAAKKCIYMPESLERG